MAADSLSFLGDGYSHAAAGNGTSVGYCDCETTGGDGDDHAYADANPSSDYGEHDVADHFGMAAIRFTEDVNVNANINANVNANINVNINANDLAYCDKHAYSVADDHANAKSTAILSVSLALALALALADATAITFADAATVAFANTVWATTSRNHSDLNANNRAWSILHLIIWTQRMNYKLDILSHGSFS